MEGLAPPAAAATGLHSNNKLHSLEGKTMTIVLAMMIVMMMDFYFVGILEIPFGTILALIGKYHLSKDEISSENI